MSHDASSTVIDFHNHYVPPRFEVTAGKFAPANQRARWDALARKLADEDLLLKDIRDGHLGARVVNIPAQLIADVDGRVPHDVIMTINDEVAALAARHPGRIHALASVEAYDGDRSAREAERAVRELGLRGLFVDCARGELMIDAPQARPTLEVAAALDVPIFVHPVAPQPLTRQMAPYGVAGTLFARGTANSAALLALIEGGVFAQLPSLRVVVTALAFGGLAAAAALTSRRAQASDTLRRHVFIDTMWPHAALIRTAIDIVGAEHVLAGSDWPIVDDGSGPLESAMLDAGLSAAERAAVSRDNCQRLLGLRHASSAAVS